MKTLRSIEDLEAYGLNYLTGEACALSQRLLFDMNDNGADLMCEYFGLQFKSAFAQAWNSQVNGKLATASIMLPRSPDFYRELFKFLLFREGYPAVAYHPDYSSVNGLDNSELAAWNGECGAENKWSLYHNPRPSGQPSVGTRNVHAMTGRTS